MSARDLEIKLSRNWLTRTGLWFGWGCIEAVCVLVVIGYALSLACSYAGLNPTDATDRDQTTRSGLRLRTDYGTGCQYLESGHGDLTPRLDAEGQPICGGVR